MASEPLITTAIDHLRAALEGITVAAGFFTEMGGAVEDELEAVDRHGAADAGVVLGIESVGQTDASESSLERVTVVLIAWHHYRRPTPAGQPTPRQLVARMARDLEVAVKADYTRGGTAADTVPLGWSPTPDPENRAIVWVEYRVQLTLLRSYSDPGEALDEPGAIA